jgi:predicted transposase YdaD
VAYAEALMRHRRVNLREILQDPEQRKELLVNAMIAIQAREGREMTRERAEEVYEKIRGAFRP